MSWEELKKNFIKATRRILERDLSKNPTTLQSQEHDLFNSYNCIIKTAQGAFTKLDERKQAECQLQLYNIRDKLRICINKLGVVLDLPNNAFGIITKNSIIERRKYNDKYELIDIEEEDQAASTSEDGQKSAEQVASETELNLSQLETSLLDESVDTAVNPIKESTDTPQNHIKKINPINNLANREENTTNPTNMPLTSVDLLHLVGKQIKTKYSGDPLELQSFIRSVNLLVRLIEGENQAIKDLLPEILLTHLDKKALECMPTENVTTQIIIDKLKENIKPDNSEVVTGKMLALKLNRGNLNEYSEQVEKLSEALERTLIIEGSTQGQAKRIATKTTVELCRNNAKSDLMKSVMASTNFETPKDVLAKFIIENSQEKQEKQIMTIKAHSKQNFRGRGRGKNRYQYNNRNNNNRQNNDNNGFRTKTFYRGNYRGQGRGRGNYRQNNFDPNIRMLGNSSIPQNAYLGAPQRVLPQISEL